MRRRVTVLVCVCVCMCVCVCVYVCVCVCVCLSVTTPAATSVVSTLKMRYIGVILGFSRFLTRGFSINRSVQKLCRKKANMQMSSYRSQPVLARFEYRAYISRYLQAAH